MVILIAYTTVKVNNPVYDISYVFTYYITVRVGTNYILIQLELMMCKTGFLYIVVLCYSKTRIIIINNVPLCVQWFFTILRLFIVNIKTALVNAA